MFQRQNLTPSSLRKEREPDPDELQIYAVRRVKKPKTGVDARPVVFKNER
jgi:hypothetical protein